MHVVPLRVNHLEGLKRNSLLCCRIWIRGEKHLQFPEPSEKISI